MGGCTGLGIAGGRLCWARDCWWEAVLGYGLLVGGCTGLGIAGGRLCWAKDCWWEAVLG